MKKTILYIVLAVLCLIFSAKAQTQPFLLTGQVSDQGGRAIPNASLQIKGEKTTALSNEEGKFFMKSTKPTGILTVSHIGYEAVELDFNGNSLKPFNIILKEDNSQLKEVEIVSTGYQNIPKERATGSFVLIDSALLNRRVSTNILDRLDGVTSGLIFNRNKTPGANDFNIRGRSTILGEDKPLIILDNFPYEGDINAINPNDVKSINILKDAAAASIWGTRAGNGVIVISTYKGNYNTKQKISINTNITIGEKPDLFQAPWFSSSHWIEIEQFLYTKGAYTTVISNGYGAISPAVEIMDQKKMNKISYADSLSRINELKAYDVRNDMLKYLYRSNVNQQYAFNLNGGGNQNRYSVSAGYDNNLYSKTTDSYNRLTLNASNSYRFLNDRIELTAGLLFTNSRSKSNIYNYSPGSPYERLADSEGKPMAVRNQLRLSYIDTAGKGKLLDWQYRPIDENLPETQSGLTSYTINAGLNYLIINGLKASVLYQYQLQTIEQKTAHLKDSFYARNLINRFSSINSTTRSVLRIIPSGDILNDLRTNYQSNNARFQLNYDTYMTEDHQITALGGIEVRDNHSENIAQTLYGYNESIGINANSTIDFTRDNPLYYNPASSERIDPGQSTGYILDHYVSFYFNGAYSFKERYGLSFSIRKDESNLFGVKPNQKGVPLWSAGLLWNISKESFYRAKWLPYLKLRASYGYSGNVSKSISAYLTASSTGPNVYGPVYGRIVNPPNPSLKWERIKVINLGLDFASKKNVISGSIEPYFKYGIDLFGESPLAPQTGVITYKGNSANTVTKGIDVTINTINLNGAIKWNSNILFSYNQDKVTKYLVAAGTNSAVTSAAYNNPIVGNPYFAIYAYKWSALDDKGDPMVIYNGTPSKAYSVISSSLDRNNIRYLGSLVPTKFGNIRNMLSYKDLELSANITYRLGYYFRRISLDNAAIYGTKGFQSEVDYDLRWQKPGDEKNTSVPTLMYPNSAQRTNIYTYSDILVEKADNIKLQDIRFSVQLKNPFKHAISSLQMYVYVNNIGYLWKANSYGLDPDNFRQDITSFSSQKTIALGLKANL
ncbi:SusC/RagA family TonB-linked outer membrane protein [Pedobacter nyackensis]|uniref:TonB-linked outer membrane protein, SusC/RagA family n=1 Tax=Pedobacter nyackensis TaxID=475255 RepID=A0A1W2DVG3_9SPHI|nr:SusC/RagA family TonB-linked outer membrane protein [Pedobacter nyackensis]SMD01347.1 TonB-linked outer membrane protein, SusC/RagA family [Pedobacter nyackensis]